MPFSTAQEKGRPVAFKDQGVTLVTSVGSINMAGAGVSTSTIGTDVTSQIPGEVGGGTVTNFSFTNANGISGSVANPTTTPTLTLTLGAIAPTSVNNIVLSGSGLGASLVVTGAATLSGSNTGDQNITGLVPYTGATGAVDLGAFGVAGTGDFLFGNQGTEGAGITIAGVTYEAVAKVSNIGVGNAAQFILHRHSTTVEPILIGARSNDNTTGHTAVTAGQDLLTIIGAGTAGTDYKQFASMNFAVSTAGAISNTSSPGKLLFNTTPNGTVTPALALTIDQDKSATFVGSVLAPSLQAGTVSAATGTLKLANSGSAFLTTIQAGNNAAAITYTWPTNVGAAGAVLTDAAGNGTLSWAVPAGGANVALSNLAGVAINAALIPGTAGALDVGSTAKPWADLWLAGSSGTPGTNQFRITGASTSGVRTITLPNASITVNAAADISGTTLAAGVTGSSLTSVGTLVGGATGAGFTVALGTSTITGVLGSTNGGTGNGFTKFTGPTTAEKTFTLPDASESIAVLGTAQTYTATETHKHIIKTNNAITATANAATVPITYDLNTVTNNSAATLTITMTTTSAVDGQMSMVRILDFSAAAQTITWVNTEDSTVTAPTTSNGSTTLFLTVGFIYNGGTSKWRCIAKA